MHSVWKRTDSVAMIFVNTTGQEVVNRVSFDATKYGINADQLAVYQCDGAEKPLVATETAPVFDLPLALPPYGVAVWIVTWGAETATAPVQITAIADKMREVASFAAPLRAKPPAEKNFPLPVTGRFVRIENTYQYISIAELEAMAGGVNAALNKPATQSSIALDLGADICGPQKAVDGNTTSAATEDLSNSVSHTNCMDDEWWEVDLGQSQTLDAIRLYNRKELPSRMLGVVLQVLDEKRNVVWEKTIEFVSDKYEFPLKP